MKKSAYLLVTLSIILTALAGCFTATEQQKTTDSYSSDQSTIMKNDATSTSDSDQASPPKSGEQIAILETSKGTIKIKFFPEIAPETVKNFVELSRKGFYDSLTFHRVIPGFMIQGGDPLGSGLGGESYKGPGTTVKAEFSDKLEHIHGAVSMARKGDDINSASSQFFIVQNAQGFHQLDGDYTVFGQAYEGLDVVDTIVKVKRTSNDMPIEPVVIKKVTIETAQ